MRSCKIVFEKMIDTHTHLYMDDYTEGNPSGAVEAVDRAVADGVGTMLLPAVDRESVEPILALHAARPEETRTMMGLHPTEVGADWREELAEIVDKMTPTDPVAIGEIGIDRHYGDDNLEWQKEAFVEQLLLAKREGLPVNIHCRDGLETCLECIEEAKRQAGGQLTPLMFHSFTGTPSDVRRIREVCDPWFGINGVVTFKNARELPEAVKEIGIDRILLETDAPFLAPVPKRGTRNESAYIPYINAKIAELLGMTPEETATITTENANKIFRI